MKRVNPSLSLGKFSLKLDIISYFIQKIDNILKCQTIVLETKKYFKILFADIFKQHAKHLE